MSIALPRRGTLDRIKAIMRRDLKLGETFEIADDMALAGGAMDLDSLDVLLLLTSVEKEFGFKVSSEDMGVAAFRSVTTLARYIDARMGGNGHDPAPDASLDRALERLPHAEPFRFVTRMLEIKPAESGQGEWRLSGQEAFFAGHFPRRPIVPGVLIAEALAQMSGVVVGANGGGALNKVLAHVDVKFRQAVAPPATLVLHSRVMKATGGLTQFEVHALCADRVVAEGTLVLADAGGAGGNKP